MTIVEDVEDLEASIDRAADEAAARPDDALVEPPLPPLRTGLVVGTSAVGAAIMLGGLFEGTAGRVFPAVAALCGVATAAQASRRKGALWVNATIVLGIVGTGIVFVLPTGVDNVTHLASILSEAKGASRVLRPPTEFLPGWRLVIGMVMATVGFAAGWVAIEFRRPAMGLLVPLPVLAYGAISVPESEKLVAGIVAAVLFIVGLALLSSLQSLIDGSSRPPGLAFELRRAARALPLLAAVVAALVLLAHTGFLFPEPRIDPTRESVAPKAVPLSQVKDRPLFTVASTETGPWRIGMLDVYENDEWRLPAFAESNLQRVPRSGVVDGDLASTVRAEFTIADLGGAVLPGLPNTTGIQAEGPRLAYDSRTGNIRLAQGQVRAGLKYAVLSAALPTEDDLRAVTAEFPKDVRRDLEMPQPPAVVADLLAQAPTTNKWDRLDFLRRTLLQTVVAAGQGTPKPVPPQRVADMLDGSKEGSPYEIVAAQAMLARWAGVPARIGYGFDGGTEIAGGLREVRPRNGSSWLEVYFPGYKWLPILGAPAKAKASLDPDAPTNTNPDVQASPDIAVQVYFPLRVEARSPFYAQVRRVVLYLLPLLALLAIAYLLWPAAIKSGRRLLARRRANRAGPQAQVAQAYAEFRDQCTDLGLQGRSRSPLGFLAAVAPDEEHEELAWLVTRVIWGDLRHAPSADHALDARELARTLRRRVSQAQPPLIRLIALVSRLSMRHPYAPELAAGDREERRTNAVAA